MVCMSIVTYTVLDLVITWNLIKHKTSQCLLIDCRVKLSGRFSCRPSAGPISYCSLLQTLQYRVGDLVTVSASKRLSVT